MTYLAIGIVLVVLGVLFAIFGGGVWLALGIAGVIVGLALSFLGYRRGRTSAA
jgi:hypothetical protein